MPMDQLQKTEQWHKQNTNLLIMDQINLGTKVLGKDLTYKVPNRFNMETQFNRINFIQIWASSLCSHMVSITELKIT